MRLNTSRPRGITGSCFRLRLIQYWIDLRNCSGGTSIDRLFMGDKNYYIAKDIYQMISVTYTAVLTFRVLRQPVPIHLFLVALLLLQQYT
jgi:hypothetical protein